MATVTGARLLLSLFAAACTVASPPSYSSAIPVSGTAAPNAGVPLDAFVSFSIEFSSFPDFAGNLSYPNTFSNNLLNNIRDLTNTKPYIRVGGNTQDIAIFNKSLDVAYVGIIDPAVSPDYPSQLTIGPAYFESYLTWPDTKYIHGFNLRANSTAARRALIASVPYACKALESGRLSNWELGNEPDLYTVNTFTRPPTWGDQQYVDEWVHWTRQIRKAMRKACPNLATAEAYKYYAPSFAGTGTLGLDPIRVWEDGLDVDKIIGVITDHNYISGANVPGVTLQHTLMNHTSNVVSVAAHLNESHYLRALPDNLVPPDLPFILGETNSLYNQGRPGLSNTFGAALWGVDFNLWCATNNISRTHMHQGTNYRYQSWQPVDTNITAKGTKAPYYGNIAVAAFLGDLSSDSKPHIVNLPLPREEEAAYAAYIGGKLARIIVINMMSYNATDYNAEYIDNYPRPVEQYSFQLPSGMTGRVPLQRLLANGSDAITGCSFDGYSYNYELNNGLPVRLNNITNGDSLQVDRRGRITVGVPRSSAVILNLSKGPRQYGGHE